MRSIFAATAALAALAFSGPVFADAHKTMDHAAHGASNHAMMTALADARRDGDKVRDEFRNPAETLAFFKVEPGMTVVDLVPGGGWYTRVLVPYLGATGKYIGLSPDVANTRNARMAESWGGLAAKFPGQLAGWGLSTSTAVGMNSNEMTDEMKGTVDRALIFREMHNLHRLGFLHYELDTLRAMLKDDGLLGIVQHRAKDDAPAAYTDGSKGYMRQQDIIGIVEMHGFELVGTSEINANPKDPANHERGVWEMPPSWGSKKEELKDLGESDRMTLLFRKRP